MLDDAAKLMYYLSCVDTVINYNEIDILTDYENLNLLSVDGLTKLFKLFLLFNPNIFVDECIFIIDDSLLPYGLDNQFYEITNERIGLHIDDVIFIGGRTVKVLEVMVYNESWLFCNYLRPWENILDLTERYQRRYSRPFYVPPPPLIQNYNPPKRYYSPPKRRYSSPAPSISSYESKKKSDGCKCCLIF